MSATNDTSLVTFETAPGMPEPPRVPAPAQPGGADPYDQVQTASASSPSTSAGSTSAGQDSAGQDSAGQDSSLRQEPRIERRKRPRPEEWTCHPGMVDLIPDEPYQELWFELRSWGWRSLVLLPTVRGASEFDLAEQLVVVGVLNTKQPITLVSAEGVSVNNTDDVIAMIRRAEARNERVIVVVDPILDNPSTSPVIRAVNGAVMVVRLGKTDRVGMERSLAAVGRDRVIGVVTR